MGPSSEAHGMHCGILGCRVATACHQRTLLKCSEKELLSQGIQLSLAVTKCPCKQHAVHVAQRVHGAEKLFATIATVGQSWAAQETFQRPKM